MVSTGVLSRSKGDVRILQVYLPVVICHQRVVQRRRPDAARQQVHVYFLRVDTMAATQIRSRSWHCTGMGRHARESQITMNEVTTQVARYLEAKLACHLTSYVFVYDLMRIPAGPRLRHSPNLCRTLKIDGHKFISILFSVRDRGRCGARKRIRVAFRDDIEWKTDPSINTRTWHRL